MSLSLFPAVFKRTGSGLSNLSGLSPLLLLLILIIIISGLRPLVVISVAGPENSGPEYYGQFLLPGEIFTLRYIHSVEKTPVEENYQTNWYGDITLFSTTFKSYGAGLPLETRNFSFENGHFLIKEMGISLPVIKIRVSRFPGQTLIFKNKFIQQEYKLQVLADPGELITIQNISLLRWFFLSSHLIPTI